jgi:hypothetical protein
MNYINQKNTCRHNEIHLKLWTVPFGCQGMVFYGLSEKGVWGGVLCGVFF